MSFLSARTRIGYSQAEVAKAMGVSDAAVSMWETGKTRPRASLLVKLADLYCCSLDELLTGNPSPDQEVTAADTGEATSK